MNTLKSPSTENPQKPALRTIVVTHSTGETHVLPYAHFLSAEVSESGTRLVLHFAMHVVLAEGSGLGDLVAKLSELRLSSLEQTPQEEAGKLTISKVRVVPRSVDEELSKQAEF
jgi:hypothetical protein